MSFPLEKDTCWMSQVIYVRVIFSNSASFLTDGLIGEFIGNGCSPENRVGSRKYGRKYY
ncbi:Uncharacterised protein [Yersinia aldovae]|uniref:Uncharacterized protein n=1 Tax=Yersinia aldovae TaxID=29483 RepID=A0A0T9TZR5_YERAL|nr:Uncharacterised protein [Yersinia aldovae]CNK66149.1 Uncharacterised protein [Yersinia aldovae]CNL11097.1 Uncharacterised protein [Yersinia aldovae]